MELGPQTLAVGIGVQRAGTSWLFRALEEHPQVQGARLPNNKEPDFFTAWWDRGEGAYADLFAGSEPVGLEFSVSYFPSLDATRRLHAFRPDARLLVCLRDPVWRALSQHRFFQTRGAPPTPFDRALPHNASYVDQSRYGTHLRRWIDTFGRDQVHAVLLDDVHADPVRVVEDACGFLGLPPQAPSMVHSQINAPDRPDRRWVRSVMSSTSYALRTVGGAQLLRAAERTGVPDRLRRAVRQGPPPMTTAEQAALDDLREQLADEVREAAGLLDRDLTHWLPGRGAAAGSQ